MVYRLVLIGTLMIGALSGLIRKETVASFTTAASTTSNQFTAGTVDISNSPASSLLTLSDMVPGETVTQPLTVTNAGTLPLRYAVASSVTNADGKGLGGQLVLTLKVGVTTCNNSGFAADGTVVYGPASPLGTPGSTRDLIGTPSANPNGGRSVANGQNEVLCFQASLPSGTGTSYQGAATTATFQFSAQ